MYPLQGHIHSPRGEILLFFHEVWYRVVQVFFRYQMFSLQSKGSIKTLCLIQKEKPSPVRKYRKRLDLLDFHGTCRLWKPSFFIQLCSSATAAIGPKSEMRHPKLLSLKSMLTLKSLSLDNRPQQRKYTLIILVFGFNKGCRQNGD